MAKEQQTVSDIFRRAQELRRENSGMAYKEFRKLLVREYEGSPFPPTNSLTIPEQDDKAPEEDWTAGLPIVLRGIQRQDWQEIIMGITLSLEQVENYRSQIGSSTEDDWHDRTVGISEPLKKGVGKWLPPELQNLLKSN